MKNSQWISMFLLLTTIASGCATSSMTRRDCGEDADCRTLTGSSHTGAACSGNCRSGNCRSGHCEVSDCQRPDDFCPDAVPTKPGTYVNEWNDAMRCAAKSDEFVIHRNAWFNGGAEPGPEAVRQMPQLAQHLAQQNDDVLLEEEPVLPKYDETLAKATLRTQQLNAARRSAVVASLQTAGVADADARVHVSSPQTIGVRGIEAPRVFNQMLQGGGQAGGRGGQNAGGGGGFGGGAGGGGFGGGRGF